MRLRSLNNLKSYLAIINQCRFVNGKINNCEYKMNSSTLKQCVTGLIMESEPEKQPVTKTESLRQSIKKKLRRSFRKLERKSSTTSQKSVLNSVNQLDSYRLQNPFHLTKQGQVVTSAVPLRKLKQYIGELLHTAWKHIE